MPGPQVVSLIDAILAQLPRHRSLDEAVEAVVASFSQWLPSFASDMAAEIAEAKADVIRQMEDVEILHRHSVMRKRDRWYFGAKPSDTHWPALRAYLLAKGMDEDDVEAVDEASNEVVSLLEDPKQNDFQCRGLVLGHVQSGKTANMTAVMAKALDAGYDTIIVLAGLTNKLRYQTQMRMFRDLVSRHPIDWQQLTPNEEHLDFRAPPQGGFLSHSDKSQLAVVKKNPAPLKQLKIAVRGTHALALKRLRVLVIDDECDQATVNAGKGEYDVSAINSHIRQLLSMIPAVSYVGYTATPFANVLIDPFRTDVVGGVDLDDLYLNINLKPKHTLMLRFKRHEGEGSIFAARSAAGQYLLSDEGGRVFQWVGDLVDLKAQRLASEVGANMHRVGVDEFEWLRLGSEKKIMPDSLPPEEADDAA